MELIVAAVVGLFLLVLFVFTKSGSRTAPAPRPTEQVPGWTSPPADPKLGDVGVALSEGSLALYQHKKHEGGRLPIFAFWWRNVHVVSVCSPRSFKETENLYNRPNLGLSTEPLHGTRCIQSVNDSEWEERKKILYRSLRGRNIEGFFERLVEIAQETVGVWGTGKKIGVLEEMFLLTAKSILATVFGDVLDGKRHVKLLLDMYDGCKREMDSAILLSTREPSTQFQQNLKGQHDYMRQILESHRQQKGKQSAFLDALVASGLPEDITISDMVTVFGGYHTSAFYLSWLLHYFGQYPEVQEKLFQDIQANVQSEESFKAYIWNPASYLRQVLDEALRLSMTAPHSYHYSNTDIVIEGYLVPAKTPIIYAMGVAQMDESIWDNPNLFLPDRFCPGSRASKRGREFRPFGISVSRRCPANQFTYMMASVIVVVLLRNFAFQSILGDEEPGKKYGVATSPTNDLQMHVKKRV